MKYLATCNLRLSAIIEADESKTAEKEMEEQVKKLAVEFPAIRKGWSAEVPWLGCTAAKLPGQEDIPEDRPE